MESQYETKLSKLLSKFLEPNFEVRTDPYLNNLISHLSGKQDAGLSERILNYPLMTEWIIHATSFWEDERNRPSESASVFILQLTSLLSRDEKRFTYFKSYNVYNALCAVMKVKASETSPSIKLAYVKMLSSLLSHKSGLDWLISTDNWRDVLKYSLEGQTIYLAREGKAFMYGLLKNGIDYNEIFCNLVVKQISSKLIDLPCQNGLYPEIHEEILRKRIEPILKLINFIFETTMEEQQSDLRIPLIFVNKFKLEESVLNISSFVQNLDFLFELDKILLSIYFIQILLIQSKDVPKSEVKKLGAQILKVMSERIARFQFLNVLRICHFIFKMWKYILPKNPEPVSEETLLRAENQLLPLEILPIVMVAFKHCVMNACDYEGDDIRDVFLSKLFKSMSEQTTRVAFQFKKYLMEADDVFVLAQHAVRFIMNNRKTYHRSRAIIIFQTFIYSFKDITYGIKEGRANPEQFVRNSSYMVSFINCLSTFINEYNITWTESVETICVLSVTLEFLNLQIWSTRVIVEALKLLNLSITKYMSPDLALLLDKTQDSSLNHVGPLLLAKLHDPNWEVRDSALEIVNTISTYSCTKFPSFQSIIKGNGLVPIVVAMSTDDAESFVRASALRCLQEMIKVTEFWNPALIQLRLPQMAMSILGAEPEAIVRTEASRLMRCVYEHQAFPIEMMDDVYGSMYRAATDDLHWEVKTNALDFWGKVVLNHLQNQGMIDGKFPDVTFSKEHKKIVTLNEYEIRLRLSKVLGQLSRCGCLGAFVSALADDCDVEVVKRAVAKLKKLASLFRKYNVTSSNGNLLPVDENCSSANVNLSPSCARQGNPPTSPMLNTPPITPRMDYSDDVIDRIVNSNDVTLLTDVYTPNGVGAPAACVAAARKHVSPEDFLRTIEDDLDAVISAKTKWLSDNDDLDSLLDDILKCYPSNEVNSMDCY